MQLANFAGNVSDDVVQVMRDGQKNINNGNNSSLQPATEMQEIAPSEWGQGTVEWESGAEMADIYLDIKNTEFEGNETAFWIELYPHDETPDSVHFGRRRTKVMLVRDDEPGSVGFLKPTYVFKESDIFACVPIHRSHGSDGEVTVQYAARDVTAKAGTHFRLESVNSVVYGFVLPFTVNSQNSAFFKKMFIFFQKVI